MLAKLVILLLAGCLAHAQRGCSRERLRSCEDNLLRSIQRRINDMGRSEMGSQCQNVREDFNCLLQQTRCLTSDSERNRYGDTLRNGLKYIRDGCDTSGGRVDNFKGNASGTWRDSSCFVGDGMKTCESSYPLAGVQYASYNPETCRKYNQFYDCAMDTLRNRCRPEDERLMGQYLVESAQDLAWNCGDQSSSSSDWTNDRNDRFGGRGGSDRYTSDRDRNYNRDRGYDNRESDRDRGQYGSGGSSYNRNGNSDYGGDITCCRNERCDRSRMSTCRDSLSRAIDSRSSGYQDSNKCRRIRDDFNCLMWQTSNCVSREERDRDNDIFRRARDFISRTCDTYGRWSENSCYKTDGMQRCEALLSSTRGGANYESCRGYLSFRDCMSDELLRRCTREDDLYQGAYLVDKAQEMSWQCGQDRNTGGLRGDNGYRPFDQKDQYDRTYDNNNNPYDNSPVHLEDEDAMCLSRAQSYTDQCKTNMDEKRRNLYTENDYYSRQKITCCSVKEYRNCLYEATRRYCQTERSRVVDSLMAGQRHVLTQDYCMRMYDSECSAGTRFHINGVLMAVCMALLSAIFAIRH